MKSEASARASRQDTENFLRSGSLDGIASRTDLALLEDLRDVAQFVIDHKALSEECLQAIIDRATAGPDVRENALDMFVALAKAQPFEDGNKRTAVFGANRLLLGAGAEHLLVIPVDEADPGLADQFNDLLAQAYVRGESDGVKDLLRNRGFVGARLR